ELEEGEFDGSRAGGDDDVLRGELTVADGDGVGGDKRRGAGDDGDLARLRELRDAAHELGDDIVLLLQERGEIEFDGAELDAVFGCVLLRPDEMLARVQQGLTRYAADIEAGAAERGA